MRKNSVFVLLIGDNQQYYEIKAMLSGATLAASFILYQAGSLLEGLAQLAVRTFDVVLLALPLPDIPRNGAIVKVSNQAPGVPIVVLDERRDAETAISTLREGAQDFLIKQEFNAGSLARSLLYAIERQGRLQDLETSSLRDELTGLFNRRGFMSFARHHMKVSERSKQGMILFYADLDNLKWLNDNYGHQAGDEAIVKAANILKGIFRSSDIVARLGGDEFAALALDSNSFPESIMARLKEKEQGFNYSFPLSLSVGFAYYDPADPCTVEELMDKADQMMYVNKRSKKRIEKGELPCVTYMTISVG